MEDEQRPSTTDPIDDRIDRRAFLQHASAGVLALSLPPISFKEKQMGVVVHSYASRWNSKVESKKYPGFSNAMDMLEHCYEIGAGGIQVGVKDWTADFAKKIRERREKLGLYLEGSIALPGKAEDVSRFEQEVISAKEAGAQVLRTVCLNGRRYETFHSNDEFLEFHKNTLTSLRLAEAVVRKNKVKLAVENHKDWRTNELLGIIQQLNSEWIGVTLDFGNSISLMEEPMEVTRMLARYAFSTHVKDMGVDEYADGFLLSEVPLGTGILDLSSMVEMCKKLSPDVTFNLEMITRDPLEIPCLTDDYWSTFEGVSATSLARTMRMVRLKKSKTALPRVSQLGAEDRLALEEQNIVSSLAYSKTTLGLK